MSRHVEDQADQYTDLWSSPSPRWVIWNRADESLIFDRTDNRPVDIDRTPVLHEILRRMREAGAPETSDYPGSPC